MNILERIRKSKFAKILAAYLAITMMFDYVSPIRLFALTGGPSQPEVQSFEPVGTTDMVDLFSGDFVYNIPLLDVDGYPINLSYHSGVTMDQEASWVGLGWNINPGVINRNMRGLPDDFKNESIKKKMNMRTNWTAGVSGLFGGEIFGFPVLKNVLSYGMGITYNNYKGIGLQQTLKLSTKIPFLDKMNANLGLTAGGDGLSVNPSLSLKSNIHKHEGTLNAELSINSREGLRELTFSASLKKFDYTTKKGEKRYYKGSTGTGISFAYPTFTPPSGMMMSNYSMNLSLKTGGTIFGVDVDYSLSGFYTEQRLAEKNTTLGAYGYLYSKEGAKSEHSLLDYNREKDGSYSREKPYLPITNFTYDVYSASGQGVSAAFRPYLSSIGTVYDNYSGSLSTSDNWSLEFNTGNTASFGTDISVNDVITTTSKWTDDNALASLNFKGPNEEEVVDPLYEPYYFKEIGEKSVDDETNTFVTNIGGDRPVNPNLEANGLNVKTTSKFVSDQENNLGANPINVGSKIYRNKRVKRNQNISVLTADEATKFGVNKTIQNYDCLMLPNCYVEIGRTDEYRKGHHISEISVNKTDGSRYVYGIPAYNITSQEASFNISSPANISQAELTGLTLFDKDGDHPDNSIENKKGVDYYFSSTETPAYAHSYLLTSVLSADFVDIDNNGPSDLDLGTYTKFNYARKKSSYEWRTPYDINETTAYYERGLRSNKNDDKGSYVEGTKEIWYLTSIETKNNIAIFTLSDGGERKDGLDNNGKAQHFLKKISLYSKRDWNLNGANATPIKEVHFEYDYTLCPHVNNNSGVAEYDENAIDLNANHGKLTLKAIYFTYQNSEKGKLNKYRFNYEGSNPSYNIKAYDRWGNYKPNNANLPNSEFPYSEQDETLANQYSSAWSLTKIGLPSGGSINVNYESDDYAFVQDKRAMQMINILGFGNSGVYSDKNELYNYNPPSLNFDANNYIFFKIASDRNIYDYVNDDQGNPIKYLYYKCLVETVENTSEKEYVSGYAEVDTYGYASDAPLDLSVGYIKIKEVPIRDSGSDKINPISKAAWQFAQLYQSDKLYNGAYPGETTPEEIFKTLANTNIFKSLKEMFKGVNSVMRSKGLGRIVETTKSFMRLYNPGWNKKGGGCRVAKLTMNDNWGDMVNNNVETDFDYGQEYDYTIKENGKTISSGVASYEPIIGNEENPWRQPVSYKVDKKWIADKDFYVEEPLGESFFPDASVGYSSVSVRNLQRENVNLTRHATGKVINQFYTTRDFPVITEQTIKNEIPKKTNAILSILKLNVKDYTTASQGYMVELNDMNGKPEATWVYSEDAKDPISGVEYYYKTLATNTKKLDNTAKVIKKDGQIESKTIGVDYDFVLDAREQQMQSASFGVNGNLAAFLAIFFPVAIPSILPSVSIENTRSRSIVATKVINKYALMDRVVYHDLGSEITVANQAYDAETGEVLLTKTYNEFKDNSYDFSYPAHWAYDGMGLAYKNTGVKMSGINFSNSYAYIPNANNIFTKGDELGLTNSSGSLKAWVVEVTDNYIRAIDKDGVVLNVTDNNSLIILRSGRRNQQTTSVGTVKTKKDPSGTSPLIFSTNLGIINATAKEYVDAWQYFGSECTSNSAECSDFKFTKTGVLFLEFLNLLAANNQLTDSVNITENPLYDTEYFHPLYHAITGSPDVTCAYYVPELTNYGKSLSFKFIGSDYVDYSCQGAFTIIDDYYTIEYITSFNSIIPPVTIDNNIYNFKMEASTYYENENVIIDVSHFACFPIIECLDDDDISCGLPHYSVVNPYLYGLRGNWRFVRDWAYLINREQYTGTSITKTNIREDGNYTSFTPFWTANNGNSWQKNILNDERWTWKSLVTKYNPFGQELENQDALGRYTSAVYGYNNTLPIAVASNAMYKEIGYDGFEDYIHRACRNTHFNFNEFEVALSNTQTGVTKDVAHTGWYSMRIMSGENAYVERCLTSKIPGYNRDIDLPFKVYDWAILGYFSPHSGLSKPQKYVLSYWVKDGLTYSGKTDYSYIEPSVSVGSASISLNNMVKSKIIDGWQQVECTFTILPENAYDHHVFKLNFKNTNRSAICYIDDVRIFPFKGNLKTYAYDATNHRLMAELDANNFATFYEYNAEGKLIRVKKETEKGIKTIKQATENQSIVVDN